ncbi:MAG: HAMP domain-containing protein [Deltaproteobacteria bacterium]|nr:HAMP domain-containing protein [Deltaproteobacteria bacterium]
MEGTSSLTRSFAFPRRKGGGDAVTRLPFQKIKANGLGRFGLPQTTLWRFILATGTIGLIVILGMMILAVWIGRSLVHELHSDKGYTVLRNAVELIAASEMAVENSRVSHFQNRKETLGRINSYTIGVLETFLTEAETGRMSNEEARKKALALLNSVVGQGTIPGFVIDQTFRLVVHPNPVFRGDSVLFFRDEEGNQVFRILVEDARTSDSGRQVFSFYPWFNPETLRQETKLAVAEYFKPWDLVVCADVFMNDVVDELARIRQAGLNELRARIAEITIGRTGYVFFFDEECRMIGHPTLAGENITGLDESEVGRSICEEFKKAAERPWGENTLVYDWNSPFEKDMNASSVISWCTREPVTGWYVGAAVHLEELDETLPRFAMSIFLPSLAAILLLCAALALLLRNLLRPVQALTTVCNEVMHGNLNVSAPKDAHGEMGFLCWNFNMMIRRLSALRKKDEQRRLDLEVLNKDLERMVEARTSALRREAAKLRQANQRLKELDDLKSSFLSSVSHELRTPLTSILGFASLIKRDFIRQFLPLSEDSPKLAERGTRIVKNLEIIEQGGWRLTRLINDLLDLNKIESGRMDWRDSVVRAGELLRRALQAASGEFIDNPNVELRLNIAEDLPEIRVDVDRLEQVMINLLSNAAKFTEKGSVEVLAHREGENLRVEVRDTGDGIPGDQLEDIFERFQQARTDSVKGKPKGTGLGLTISRQIIEHYGGRIWAESTPGLGSVFVFTLPLSQVGIPGADRSDRSEVT